MGLSPTMVCVDTWLNNQQWADLELRGRTCAIGGKLQLMQQFMTNVMLSDMSKFIAPYPQTSVQAARVMQKEQVVVDIIYHDASNEEEDIYNDLVSYWPLLRQGGILFGTDYMACWPGEVRAINRFCAEKSLILRTIDPKWFVYKP